MNFGRYPVQLGPYAGLMKPVSEDAYEKVMEAFEYRVKEMDKPEYAETPPPRDVVGRVRRRIMESFVEFREAIPDSFYESKEYPISVQEDALLFFMTYEPKISNWSRI